MELSLSLGDRDFFEFTIVDENKNPFASPTVQLSFGTYDAPDNADWRSIQNPVVNGYKLTGAYAIDNGVGVDYSGKEYFVWLRITDGGTTRHLRAADPLLLR
jgi:hypothetical protein